jgi:uncharacterized membrane protein
MLILKIFLISMIPIGELRAGIPYGLLQGLNPILTYIVAVLGNMVPVIFLLWGLPYIDKVLNTVETRHASSLLARLYNRYKTRTERKYSKRFARLGAIALISFVAIPLPITGAWTGTLAAYILGVQPKKALPLILLGVMIAGAIMTLISIGLL